MKKKPMNHTMNTFKRTIKTFDKKKLMEALKEKERELQKANQQLMAGSKRIAYGSDEERKFRGPPVKIIRKQIAIIKTFLNVKLKGGK